MSASTVNQSDTIDWREVQDPIQRRKLQNRKNQRLSRVRRHKQSKNANDLVIRLWQPVSDGAQHCASVRNSELSLSRHLATNKPPRVTSNDGGCPNAPQSNDASDSQPTGAGQLTLVSKLHYTDNVAKARRLERAAHLLESSIQDVHNDGMITLSYYNVLRGLLRNIADLGLNLDQLCEDIYPSPFLPLSPTASSHITRLPPDLAPSPLQKLNDHPAYIDIFPCATIRDNIIMQNLTGDEEDFFCEEFIGCGDICAQPDGQTKESQRTGLTLWGDPARVESWEVSQYIASKYPWLLKGAFRIQLATNAWRRRRGWQEISFAE